MKTIIVVGLLLVLGCERTPATPPVSKPRATLESEPLLVEYAPNRLSPTVVRTPVTLPSLPKATPSEIDQTMMPTEYHGAMRWARIRMRVHQARTTLQQQEALLAYVDLLENDYLKRWNSNDVETGAVVIQQMQRIHRFRTELESERDHLRRQLESSERQLLHAEQAQGSETAKRP